MTPHGTAMPVACTPHTHVRRFRPLWLRAVLVGVLALAFTAPMALSADDAEAQRRRRRRGKKKPAPKPAAENRDGPAAAEPSDLANPADGAAKPSKGKKGKTNAKVRNKGKSVQEFDFSGMSLYGSERKPQLLYFLERANEELERASLERRSFIPEMVRSLDEEAL